MVLNPGVRRIVSLQFVSEFPDPGHVAVALIDVASNTSLTLVKSGNSTPFKNVL